MSEKSIAKEIYKGTFWSILDNFVKQVFTFIVFIVLARLLAPEIIGLLAFAMLFVQVFRNVIFDSIATAIVRKSVPDKTDYNTGFVLCILISVPAFIILFLSSDLFETWTNSMGLSTVIKGTSFILLTAGLSRMHEAWLQHQMNFKSLAIRSSVATFFGGVLGIILAYKNFGIYSLVAQQVGTALLELILIWIVTPWKPKFEFSYQAFREIKSYGKHVALTGLTNFANQNSDSFFVTYYLGAAANGIYSTGKRIVSTLNTVISASLLRVSLPAFARIKDNTEELKNTFLQTTGITATLTAPLFAGLSILSKDITLLLLGDKWLESAYVMQIVTLTGFLFSIGYYNQSVMLVKNKPQWQTRLTILYALTNIAAFILFTKYGVIYTALAFSLRALLLYPLSVWCSLVLLKCSFKEYFRQLFPSLAATALMVILIYFLSLYISTLSLTIRLVILIFTGILSYLFFIYLFIPKSYKNKLKKVFARKKHD
ncbi:lipopolysaccharide biosynthesis protein [Pseudopedobacter beijingensis]|uniref:Lipopolysaccharide biosynthesis protein n=1 Tax=Pseudopedobacter beijingensis TaxID=1207056 RepID=A0ABW4IEC7_9SPHI